MQEYKNRHPVLYKFREHFKFDKKAYVHSSKLLYNLISVKIVKGTLGALEEDIKNLKHEKSELKKDAKIKKMRLHHKQLKSSNLQNLCMRLRKVQ